MSVRIASFDIGKKNFAFCIEEFDPKRVRFPFRIPEKDQYNKDGTPTENMKKILDRVCEEGKLILHKNVDLTKNCDKRKSLDPETFYNMNDVLDSYSEFFDTCDTFIIEQQMSFGARKSNVMAQKLGQHCFSYFACKYGRNKKVIEFPAYHKTQVLGAPKEVTETKTGKTRYKAISKPKRKKWAVKKAMEILSARGEEDIIGNLKTAAKKDDLADVLVQLCAYKFLHYVKKSH